MIRPFERACAVAMRDPMKRSTRSGTERSGKAAKPINTRELYDLVVVGGGISGLAAAYFFRKQAGDSARILILENHDDFGGHAKRNEFHLGGRMQLVNGGTVSIDSPTPYSAEADGLLKELGIDAPALAKKYRGGIAFGELGLKPAFFFDKETFGEDRLVVGMPGRGGRESAIRPRGRISRKDAPFRTNSKRHRAPAGRIDRLHARPFLR